MDEQSPNESRLNTPVRFVRGVGGNRSALLERINVRTVGHLLLTLPRRYEDRRNLKSIAELRSGDFATVHGTVTSAAWVQPRGRRGFFEAIVTDGSAMLRCQWFNARYLADQVKPGDRLVLFGKCRTFKGVIVLQHPDMERAQDDDTDESIHMGRIVPVYPLTEGLGQRAMRRILWNAVEEFVPDTPDILPAEVLQRRGLLPLQQALHDVHFPPSIAAAARARDRLAFDEFLAMQYVLVARRARAGTVRKIRPAIANGALRAKFLASLPFQLTGAQQRSLTEIAADMRNPSPMHRLLQGDVGSGKTVVAACAALDAIETGLQVAVMAPTEILAAQHHRTLTKYLSPMGITLQLLTSGMTDAEKISARAAIADGRTKIVCGTHALIQDRVVFKSLGLAVIDEQHKFGVEQRGVLYDKGTHPDVLVMTATPIPRTLAMTLYGDLDISVIDELPAGRLPIVTRVIGEAQLEKAYDFIRNQVAKGRQAYIVYPMVNESDTAEMKSAVAMYDNLRMTAFAGLPLGLLHGQMKPEDKDDVMRRFRAASVAILVATTVIEVGVDVPNATVMLVENAERFGLAQLHQLRGRIGRGAHKSYCILQGHPNSRDAWQRLKVMAETNDGFRIAEEDFRIRGMGNLLGREQSGLPLLRVGDPLADIRLLEAARDEATRLVEQDPQFKDPALERLRQRARDIFREAGGYVKVG